VFYLNVAKVDRVLHMLQSAPPAVAIARALCMHVGSGEMEHGAAWHSGEHRQSSPVRATRRRRGGSPCMCSRRVASFSIDGWNQGRFYWLSGSCV
jgi:hypothetical protein